VAPISEGTPLLRTNDKRPELIPRRLIFADLERSLVRISPDGTRIVFRAPVDGVLNLWVAPIDRVEKAYSVTAVADRNLPAYRILPRPRRRRELARLASRSPDRRYQAADTRTWSEVLHSADLAPFSPQTADWP